MAPRKPPRRVADDSTCSSPTKHRAIACASCDACSRCQPDAAKCRTPQQHRVPPDRAVAGKVGPPATAAASGRTSAPCKNLKRKHYEAPCSSCSVCLKCDPSWEKCEQPDLHRQREVLDRATVKRKRSETGNDSNEPPASTRQSDAEASRQDSNATTKALRSVTLNSNTLENSANHSQLSHESPALLDSEKQFPAAQPTFTEDGPVAADSSLSRQAVAEQNQNLDAELEKLKSSFLNAVAMRYDASNTTMSETLEVSEQATVSSARSKRQSSTRPTRSNSAPSSGMEKWSHENNISSLEQQPSSWAHVQKYVCCCGHRCSRVELTDEQSRDGFENSESASNATRVGRNQSAQNTPSALASSPLLGRRGETGRLEPSMPVERFLLARNAIGARDLEVRRTCTALLCTSIGRERTEELLRAHLAQLTQKGYRMDPFRGAAMAQGVLDAQALAHRAPLPDLRVKPVGVSENSHPMMPQLGNLDPNTALYRDLAAAAAAAASAKPSFPREDAATSEPRPPSLLGVPPSLSRSVTPLPSE